MAHAGTKTSHLCTLKHWNMRHIGMPVKCWKALHPRRVASHYLHGSLAACYVAQMPCQHCEMLNFFFFLWNINPIKIPKNYKEKPKTQKLIIFKISILFPPIFLCHIWHLLFYPFISFSCVRPCLSFFPFYFLLRLYMGPTVTYYRHPS